MNKNSSLVQLFLANFKILVRGWRALFWNLVLPAAIYIGLALLKLRGVAGMDLDYANYLLPGVVAMTVMQTGIYSLAYWLIDLRQRGVLKRFMVTPISPSQLISSLVATRLILMLVQVAIISLIGATFFNARVAGNTALIMLFVILGGAIFLSIGFLISVVANSYDEAAPITTVANLLLTVLGNVFFPSSILPAALRAVSDRLPLSYLADGLRTNYLGTATIANTVKDLLGLLIWLALIFALMHSLENPRQKSPTKLISA